MLNPHKTTSAFILVAALLIDGLVLAATAKKPSGTVMIDETQFGFILGGSTGDGTLTFPRQKIRFQAQRVERWRQYRGVQGERGRGSLRYEEAFAIPGTYTVLNASIALGGGGGGLEMQNENGVIMRLESRTQGLQFNMSVSGVKVTMGK
jgi:hypothetical protein